MKLKNIYIFLLFIGNSVVVHAFDNILYPDKQNGEVAGSINYEPSTNISPMDTAIFNKVSFENFVNKLKNCDTNGKAVRQVLQPIQNDGLGGEDISLQCKVPGIINENKPLCFRDHIYCDHEDYGPMAFNNILFLQTTSVQCSNIDLVDAIKNSFDVTELFKTTR